MGAVVVHFVYDVSPSSADGIVHIFGSSKYHTCNDVFLLQSNSCCWLQRVLEKEASAAHWSVSQLMAVPPGRKRRQMHDDITGELRESVD